MFKETDFPTNIPSYRPDILLSCIFSLTHTNYIYLSTFICNEAAACTFALRTAGQSDIYFMYSMGILVG